MGKLNIILNGRIVTGYSGETILHFARRHGVDIPTLCHDERLEPFSSCYVCVVEVKGMRGLQPSCSTKLVEGMRIDTDNERVRKSRKSALELLVSNHYADCVAPCRETCPAGVDVQGYIAMINRGMPEEAVRIIKETNPLPAICGRVCVRPCELACRRNLVEGAGVGIDYLKRYASDIDLESASRYMPELKPPTAKKVAVVGAGPGGLTAAYYLAIEGHDVTIYEASKHVGGMLRYGIPPYRLPNEIIEQEVEGITGLGVNIVHQHKLGENLSYERLKRDYHAVILAIGSQNSSRIGCENDDAGHVYSGIEFLRNMEATGQKYDFSGKTVAVIGGGNTAMDCCRTAKRCGAEKVIVLYRRTEKEMPANPIEIHESKLEGVEYNFLTAPARINPDDAGNVRSITCFRMELGEPDASGRRRPVKVDGSEFDVAVDVVLAAIGQKTDVNFLDDINRHADSELVLNKWGDIDADPKTLQTSIENVFACGDGVTGPATLIEAIAQGKRAARSCSYFLNGKILLDEPFEFLSRRDHFEVQQPGDYSHAFASQEREEMPTLHPADRHNFDEVELGYTVKAAMAETHRCMECGCTELHTCDLKKHATAYRAAQKHYQGEYKKYRVNFDHPFIEIDNNKCILCSRCVRICSEVVGANALGLINRGFDTYVAPSLDGPLADTHCESCGMCIDSCPTGAITENIPFKPAPVNAETFKTICNYCSVGCELVLHHQQGFVMRSTGGRGLVNKDGSICGFGKFGYRYMNDSSRISRPLLRDNDSYQEISFDEAYHIIKSRILGVNPDENAFYAGARLTNEEIYLIQKLARVGVGTNNISNFHYMGRGSGYRANGLCNVPFEQISQAGSIFLLGSDINMENAVPGYYIYNRHFLGKAPLVVITDKDDSPMSHKASKTVRVDSYYYFIKAAIHYLLAHGRENRVFIDDHTRNFDDYRDWVLKTDYGSLLTAAGCSDDHVSGFANAFNNEHHAILVFSEKHVSGNACHELRNLTMITGKSKKTACGLIALKEKNNAQGIFDMGACAALAPGGLDMTDMHVRESLAACWGVDNLPATVEQDQWKLLIEGRIKNAFIFGEDPMGCAIDKDTVKSALGNAEFVVVQDLFMSETAGMADLVLPASLHTEIGGSFTNTQKYIQQFQANHPDVKEYTSLHQLQTLLQMTGVHADYDSPAQILLELAAFFHVRPDFNDKPYEFCDTGADNPARMFEYGCDFLQKKVEEKKFLAKNAKENKGAKR